MDTRNSPEVDELWNRFHQVVNMTSRELVDWLGVQPDLDPHPGPDGPAPLGMAAVSVLGKRRVDLTVEDLAVMQKIIDVVDEETADVDPAQLTNDERRRHRLMNVGHDPLRADYDR